MHKNDFLIKMQGIFSFFFSSAGFSVHGSGLTTLVPRFENKPPINFKDTVFISYCTKVGMRSSAYVITFVDSSWNS